MNVPADPQRVAAQLRRTENLMSGSDATLLPVLRMLRGAIYRVKNDGAPEVPETTHVAEIIGGWTVSRLVIDGQAAVRIEFRYHNDPHGLLLRVFAEAAGLSTPTSQTPNNHIPVLLGRAK